VNGPERDLLVLGGGVTGLAIARIAARSGWSVSLVERDDLATGASSSTSHMLHGGLRYLEQGRFRLVREALSERMAVSRLAPALARPVRFLVPLRRGDASGHCGCARAWHSTTCSPVAPAEPARPRRRTPGDGDGARARASGLRAAGIYSDVVMDDARLAMAVARDAATHGAEILTHTELVAARPEPARAARWWSCARASPGRALAETPADRQRHRRVGRPHARRAARHARAGPQRPAAVAAALARHALVYPRSRRDTGW
jgi:glycerol-3-phosphate dehydrogenase